MVQLNTPHTPSVGLDKARRRALLVARYQELRAHGRRHASHIEHSETIAETVTRTRARGLARAAYSDEPAPEDHESGDENSTGQSSRFATHEDTAPTGRHLDAVLNRAERARLRLEVEIARDGELWHLGRAMNGWLCVVGG